MPRVSIIIAAYNPGIHLATTLDAVIAQTFADWEAIVVDDGSTEDLSQFAHVDPRITLVRQPNRGLSAARNAAIMRSSGEFLAFLDQDDIWLPNKLERQLAAMEADPELAFCYTNFHRIDAAGAYIGPGYDGGAETYAGLLLGCCVCVSTAMIRRSYLSAVGTFDPLFVGSQDYDLWLKLARRYKVKYLETASVQYRQHANTISSRYAELYVEICQILKRHAATERRHEHSIDAAISPCIPVADEQVVEDDAARLVLADVVHLLLGACKTAAAIGKCAGAERDAIAVRRQRKGIDIERKPGELLRCSTSGRDRVQLRAAGLAVEEVHRLAVGREAGRVDVPAGRRQALRRRIGRGQVLYP